MQIVPVFPALIALAAGARAQSCFEHVPVVPVGHLAGGIVIADADGDGDLDLATANWGSQDVTVLWNQGDGSWAAPTTLAIGPGVLHVRFADVDGDLDADLVCARQSAPGVVVVRRNLGAHAFAAAEPYTLVGFNPHDLECADADADGDVDVIVACNGDTQGGPTHLTVLRNAGDGTFGTASTYPFAAPERVAVADFDGDSDLDIAAVRLDMGIVAVYGGSTHTIPVGWLARDLGAADFDGDGRPDLAVAQQNNAFSILIDVVPGGFAPYVQYPTLNNVTSIVAADLDADGDPDVACLSVVASKLEVFLNAGDGTFTAAGSFDAGPQTYALASGDLDGDGDGDLAFPLWSADSVRVLRSCAVSDTPTCFGDGSATACPCGNASPVGARAGCLHSLGAGGTLRATGAASLAADSVVLRGASMPNASVLYFQGASAVNGGLGTPFGDGLSCAGGSVRRLGTTTNVAGASAYPSAGQPAVSVRGDVTSPGERHYQVWYRNAASFCTPSTFNLTNSLRLTWRP